MAVNNARFQWHRGSELAKGITSDPKLGLPQLQIRQQLCWSFLSGWFIVLFVWFHLLVFFCFCFLSCFVFICKPLIEMLKSKLLYPCRFDILKDNHLVGIFIILV